MNKLKCECADPGCPACRGKCKHRATNIAFRVDMEDRTGTPMCSACASDALDSGVFRTRAIIRHTTNAPARGTEGA